MRSVKAVWFVGPVLALALTGCGGGPEEGGRAPRFSLKAQDGTVVSNDALKGRVVLLSFWSTTCGPCVREVPELQKLDDDGRVKVIGVALDPGGWASVQPFVRQHDVRYCVVLGDEDLFQRFDGYALPYSLLLDESQKVVRIYRGAVNREAVDRDVKAIGQGS
jgi:thiol-disulfide isomerase/thioredoxin